MQQADSVIIIVALGGQHERVALVDKRSKLAPELVCVDGTLEEDVVPAVLDRLFDQAAALSFACRLNLVGEASGFLEPFRSIHVLGWELQRFCGGTASLVQVRDKGDIKHFQEKIYLKQVCMKTSD